MVKRIYVGNLPFTSSEDEIRELFASFGPVHSVKLITDRETGRPRGFGFVEMDAEGAAAAIEALDNSQLGGRTLRVNEAHERKPGSRGPRGPRGPRDDRGDRGDRSDRGDRVDRSDRGDRGDSDDRGNRW
jgi:RNA recognition motif-containing protein